MEGISCFQARHIEEGQKKPRAKKGRVPMAENSGLAEFKQGISLLREGHSSEALEYLRRASELKQQNPYYLSFLGVAMARAEHNWSGALELCKTAASMR